MEKHIIMSVKELSRYEIITSLIQGHINGTQAAKQLQLSVRQVKRVKAKVRKHGAWGAIHQNRGRPSNNRTPPAILEKTKKFLRAAYADFKPTFAAEKLRERHAINLSSEKVRQLMTAEGLWKPKPRKQNKQYRSWRPRKEYVGEMEQFDGSYHRWFEDRAPECCLLASVDDATGTITKAEFAFNESVCSVFAFWKAYVEKQGKPLSIYLDKYSTYKVNHASAVDNSELLTQFERAARQLNIRLITAHSPQAKGRIERLFETLQDRLVKELRLRNISAIEEANQFLEDEYVPRFNTQFGVKAVKGDNLHRALVAGEGKELDHIFSVHSERHINNDFTIRFQNNWIQLERAQPTTVFRTDKVLLEEWLDGTLHIKLRNKYLNFHILPRRPERTNPRVIALVRKPSARKPPADHLWRRRFIMPNPRYQTSSQAVNVL